MCGTNILKITLETVFSTTAMIVTNSFVCDVAHHTLHFPDLAPCEFFVYKTEADM
jgi:hypothetical protein